MASRKEQEAISYDSGFFLKRACYSRAHTHTYPLLTLAGGSSITRDIEMVSFSFLAATM